MVAQVDDLVGVPLVAEDEEREEDEGDEHRGRAQAAGGGQDRSGCGHRACQDPCAGEELAQPLLLDTDSSQMMSVDRFASCNLIAPGGTSTRSWPSSFTLSL